MTRRNLDQPKKRSVVLNIGVSQSYLIRREQILHDAGFAVVNSSVEEAKASLANSDVCLVIFGHLVPASDRLTISGALRKSNPHIRIVVMYDHSVQRTESADAVLQRDVPAERLVHTVEYLLTGRDPSLA